MIINGITLKNPDWGDADHLDKLRILHYFSRDNTRRTYIKRGERKKIKFTLGYAKYGDIISLFNTLKNSMHQTISITDWDGNVISNCNILTNPLEITHKYRQCDPTDSETEGYELSLEVEGDV